MASDMHRIYVAGSYNAPNVIQVFNNMRLGMRQSLQVLLAGFSPFCPWLDYQFTLLLRENEALTIDDYYRYSMAWLEVSDAVLVMPNSENSKGTQAELERAREIGIPIFASLEDLVTLSLEVENEPIN